LQVARVGRSGGRLGQIAKRRLGVAGQPGGILVLPAEQSRQPGARGDIDRLITKVVTILRYRTK
jgi:hypothetical protein